MNVSRNILGGVLLLIGIQISLQEDLSGKAKLINPNEYFAKVIQETFYELENEGFCNLKLADFNQTIDENLYNWHVKGHVEYTDGFLHSIGRITVTDITGDIPLATGEPVAVFTADLELVPATVGYDVTAHFGDQGVHRFTGTYRHPHIKFNFNLRKSLVHGNMTVTSQVSSVGAGSGLRMVYMPENSFSEVLSRKFSHDTFSSAHIWARDVISPIIKEKAEIVPFPKYCFVNNPQRESC